MFLFANPRSGSQQAARYTNLEFDNCEVMLSKKESARVYVYDLTDQ